MSIVTLLSNACVSHNINKKLLTYNAYTHTIYIQSVTDGHRSIMHQFAACPSRTQLLRHIVYCDPVITVLSSRDGSTGWGLWAIVPP